MLDQLLWKRRTALKQAREAGRLDRESRDLGQREMNALEDYRQRLDREAVPPEEAMDSVRGWFGEEVARRKQLAEETGAMFTNAFRFLETTFGDSQELVIFVTEITAGYDTSPGSWSSSAATPTTATTGSCCSTTPAAASGRRLPPQRRKSREIPLRRIAMNEELKRIEAVLDEKVRPALRSHGGELEIDRLEGRVLYVKLLAVRRCPSADLTNETVIEAEVVKALPDLVERVAVVQTVSDELWEQAKRLLRDHHL